MNIEEITFDELVDLLKQKLNSIETKNEELTEKKTELIPLTKWNDYYDYPTVGTLRQLVFYEHSNGFSKVIRRIGCRIYIKVSAFFEWVEETNRNQYIDGRTKEF